MKKIYVQTAAVVPLVFGLLLSCAGAPAQLQKTASQKTASQKTAPQPAAPPVQNPETKPLPVETETEIETEVADMLPDEEYAETLPEEVPVAEELPEPPAENEQAIVLAEPEIDLPEAGVVVSPPPESALPEILPEPSAPVIALPPPEPLPVPAIPPPPAPPSIPVPAPPPIPVPAPPPAPLPSPVPPPTPARQNRPQPPAYLGPAEDERPPAIVQEPVPVPEQPAVVNTNPIPQQPPPDEAIIFSRTVRALVGQLVEIPFRGTGWVFLGELGARRGISYDSRRLDPDGQSFVFQTAAAGTYVLKFFKQDFVRDFILNDYVQVLVGEETSAPGVFNPLFEKSRVIAEPRWPSSLEEARIIRDGGLLPPPPALTSETGEGIVPTTGASRPQIPEPQTAAPVPPVADRTLSAAVPLSPDSPPEFFFQKAREEFEAGRAAQAISVLDQFTVHYPAGSDESYWLYGQFYEANSPSRNILTALDYYRRLVREYPQSSHFNDARRRITYLERYYINIQ